MAILRPLTKSQYEVSFTALGGPTFTAVFTTFSGINDSSESSTYANGTGNRLFHVVGPRTAENITLNAPYDPSIFKDLNVEFHLLKQLLKDEPRFGIDPNVRK